MDFINTWSEESGFTIERFLQGLDLSSGKSYEWRQRYGTAKNHKRSVPRDFAMTSDEKRSILDF